MRGVDDFFSAKTIAVVGASRDDKKVGHAGTLDPFATGLLLMAIGRGATKQMGKLNKKGIGLNRKVLADLAMNDADAFAKVVEAAKAAL